MTVRDLSNWGVESLRATRDTIITYIPSVRYPMQKRLLDIVLGILALVVFSIPMALISILIKSSSKGPIFYTQNRVGLNGEVFKIYKFRTMNCLESDSEFTPALLNDPRVNKIGMVLRKTSLDELPNLLNVIKGEMSLVGPRPHAVKMDQEFCNLSNDYRQRHKVKPGITGLAQVSGYRGSTDTLEKILGRIRCDLNYVKDANIILDMKILLKTISAVALQARREIG